MGKDIGVLYLFAMSTAHNLGKYCVLASLVACGHRDLLNSDCCIKCQSRATDGAVRTITIVPALADKCREFNLGAVYAKQTVLRTSCLWQSTIVLYLFAMSTAHNLGKYCVLASPCCLHSPRLAQQRLLQKCQSRATDGAVRTITIVPALADKCREFNLGATHK